MAERREYCPHCDVSVCKKMYLAHRRLYYDSESQQWVKKTKVDGNFCADIVDFDALETEDEELQPSCSADAPPPLVDFVDFGDDEICLHETGTTDQVHPEAFQDHDVGEVEVWEEEGIEEDIELMRPPEETISVESNHSLVLWLVHYLSLLQKQHYIPNAAVAALLQFLFVFFNVLARIVPQTSSIFSKFPRTLLQLQKLMGTHQEEIVRYVYCEKCSHVYMYNECIEKIGTRIISKLCSYKASNYAQPCHGELLKCVERPNKDVVYYPLKVYCYTRLYNYITHLVSRPGFCELCDHWKADIPSKGIYRDIYDGDLWQKFKEYDGKPCLSAPFTYGLMLNLDWFKPCKHTEYSLGALYLTVMNLPRRVRFRQENVLLIGLIPGPKEPKHDVNSILAPLVEELLRFWNGVEINGRSSKTRVRCILLCVACDIPASRKVCGFLGHSAALGCSKCLKHFPGPIGQRDYSGFDRSQWQARTVSRHRGNVSEVTHCCTLTEQKSLESKYGCRYSVLLDLPYFDPVVMTIIDPMHNLYLGSAKRMINLWIEKGFITAKDLSQIQSCVNLIQVPHYVGRIPHKIQSSFSGFTADQFKNWTNLFSLMVLHDLLPPEHLRCWRYFVLASRILCQMKITDEEIKFADALLLQFCCEIESLYGKNAVTPNMHLHCHLKQSLHDYGPVHNFWLFSYERYNGILETFPSNNRSLEVQLMNKFYREFVLSASAQNLPEEYISDFGSILQDKAEPALKGSLQVTIHGENIDLVDPRKVQEWTVQADSEVYIFPKVYIRSTLCVPLMAKLKQLYMTLYPNYATENIDLNSAFRKYSSITTRGIKFNCNLRPIVYVTNLSTLKPRPALLEYFMLHSFHYNNRVHQHMLAAVSWLKDHHAKDCFGKPLELWWKDLFDTHFNTFIPVQMLICHSVNCDVQYEEQTVCLMCPVHNIPGII